MNKFNVALDGPAGAGKSTVAKHVANALGFIYVDTGAMYRAVTWKALQLGLDMGNVDRIGRLAREMNIVLSPSADGQRVIADGTDITEAIRSYEVTHHVSIVASIPEVRRHLVALQKRMADSKGVVMDGRDIGTNVLPDAEVKVFLTASAQERAERRLKEQPDINMTLEEMEREIVRRDRLDSEREISPLCQAEDAVLLDSTTLTLTEVINRVLELCRANSIGGR